MTDKGERSGIHEGVIAAVEMALRNLTDQELATFNNLIGWGDDDLRSQCKNKSWFPQVENLFTENDGKKIHSDAIAAIGTVVEKRLSEK